MARVSIVRFRRRRKPMKLRCSVLRYTCITIHGSQRYNTVETSPYWIMQEHGSGKGVEVRSHRGRQLPIQLTSITETVPQAPVEDLMYCSRRDTIQTPPCSLEDRVEITLRNKVVRTVYPRLTDHSHDNSAPALACPVGLVLSRAWNGGKRRYQRAERASVFCKRRAKISILLHIQ